MVQAAARPCGIWSRGVVRRTWLIQRLKNLISRRRSRFVYRLVRSAGRSVTADVYFNSLQLGFLNFDKIPISGLVVSFKIKYGRLVFTDVQFSAAGLGCCLNGTRIVSPSDRSLFINTDLPDTRGILADPRSSQPSCCHGRLTRKVVR